MTNTLIYLFPHPNSPPLAAVGGKGLSLILGSQAELPVPPGFILSVDYFIPWLEMLKKSDSWTTFLKAKQNTLEKSCNALKKQALHSAFTKQQEQELAKTLKLFSERSLFAVRSSSPEEDLEGSSFAGGYETILGVTAHKLKEAIKKAFSSCLDYRVVVYKRENGFDVTQPQIAVIIQEQIRSEIAGVGFSLNPLTNNYDEAVFTANWGLGETVVAGTAIPDTYLVDKTKMEIKDKTAGSKEITISLLPDGGTKEEHTRDKSSFTLSDSQVFELTQLIKKVEAIYKKPIDVEWAYAKEKLYLLQARPITTYIPLTQTMVTLPGEKKRLYIDFSLSLQGITQPISITGTSFFTCIVRRVGNLLFLRDITKDIDTAIPWISPGRMYVNLSNVLKLFDKKKLANFLNIIDPLAAKTIQNIHEQEYVSNTNKLRLLPIGAIRLLPRVISQVIHARLEPGHTHHKSQQRLHVFMQKARELVEKELSFTELTDKLLSLLIHDVFLNTVPLFITGKMALEEMKKLAGKELAHAFAPLNVALPNNVTTEMGLALYQISELLPTNLNETEILEGIKKNTLPQPFMTAWVKFLKNYGFRGAVEIDIATPRYEDKPELLISLLITMKSNNKHDNPKDKFRKNQEENHHAYEYMYHELQKKDSRKAKRFQQQSMIFKTFAGYRESHKFYLVFVLNLVRQKILKEAQSLYAASRLESVEQIFDLTLEELDKATSDTTFNLIDRAHKNRLFINRLAQVTNLPTLIDSRGFILHPPAPHTSKGAVVGTPISPGIVQGPIKVLHAPNEKPFLKGDILVARATDPGWTPLFVNAAAIILEIGGVLQHGALVAREYGLPCVAGVENATALWEDGTLVEVDGTIGTIRLVTKAQRKAY